MPQRISVALELKALGSREFEGHGAVFRNVDVGGDVVVPGAFKRSLARHEADGGLPQMFWMHKQDHVPGVWTEMREDDTGLYVKGELVDTSLGNEMRTLLQRKAVRGLSIGYRPVETDWDKDGNRLLKEIDLWEVSLVSLAMNPMARVEAAKSRLSGMGEYVPTEREFERILRDAGCSRKTALTLVARLYDDPDISGTLDGHQRDAGEVEPEAAEVLKSLAQMTDRTWSSVFRRP